jgi:hypothetical protein
MNEAMLGMGEERYQEITNSKLQKSNKSQVPMFKTQAV